MVSVTKKFRDDFRDVLRRDLVPGPDQLRQGVAVIVAAGVEVPAAIDHEGQRSRLWAEFFAEARAIRERGAA